MPWWTVANLLTGLRGLLIPVMVWAILEQAWVAAFFVFWLAVVTDLLDGRVARRRREVSRLGGVLDHSVDALFVSAGLAALAARGAVPVLLAPLIALAFLQYAADSRVLAGRSLRTSFLGRNNGIAYYVLLGTPIVRETLGLGWPGPGLLQALGWLLVVTTLVSMSDRALMLLLNRKVRDSPGEER